MKKVLALFGMVAITAVATIILYEFFQDEIPLPKGVIQAKLFSQTLNEEREIIVHLPANYDSSVLYPVIYVLDGSSQDEHVAMKFNILSAAGYAPETIVVGIPNMSAENRERYLTPPFMRINADEAESPFGEGDKFLSFMESELIPFVEKNYGTSQVRLFHGHSRGGLLVMYSLIYKPDLFQARFCYSTPLWRQENILIQKVTEYLSATDSLNSFLFLSAGADETDNIKMGTTRMAEQLEKNAPPGLKWFSYFTPRATHQNNAQLSASVAIGKWCEYRKR